MVFTTQIFLFAFFPLCLFTYILIDKLDQCGKIGSFFIKIRAKDILLIAFSCLFYMWACFNDLFKLLFYILMVYLAARWIEFFRDKRLYINIHKEESSAANLIYKRIYIKMIPFVIAISAVLLCLIYYKYAGFLTQIWNAVFNIRNTSESLLAPIGISFITFSAISYLADIYRGKATCGSLIDCTLYLSFFPKIVSGPIVLWKDFQQQIKSRNTSLTSSTDGLNRIMIGFAKKVLLADTFGACLANIGLSGIDQVTAAGTLIINIVYAADLL